jgi:hypothetical protein
MKKIEIRPNKYRRLYTIIVYVTCSILGFYYLFMTDMFVDKPVPKVIMPLVFAFMGYHSYKLFVDYMDKKVVFTISTKGIEISDDKLKAFDWADIKEVEIKKEKDDFRTDYILKVTGDNEKASIYITGLDLGHKEIIDLIKEYSKGTTANKMFMPAWGDV